MWVRETETQTEKQRETDRQKDRQTDRKKDRQSWRGVLALPQLRAKTVLWRACRLTVISCILAPSSPLSFWCLWSILFVFLVSRYIFFLFTHSLFFSCISSPVSWVELQVVTFRLLCDKQDNFVSNLIFQRRKSSVGLKEMLACERQWGAVRFPFLVCLFTLLYVPCEVESPLDLVL